MFLQVLAYQMTKHQKQHANLLGFFQASLLQKRTITYVGLRLFSFRPQGCNRPK